MATSSRSRVDQQVKIRGFCSTLSQPSRPATRPKRARSLLDFDDLIEKLGGLLGDEARGMWVRYKLDSGISHILVDEGQDTNPQQWDVISALVAEFFYGDSAADRPRTLFVVGDQKQSIFSFQGADPEVFVDLGRQVELHGALRSISRIEPVKLRHSFRTLPNVLDRGGRGLRRSRPRGGRARGPASPTIRRAPSRAAASRSGRRSRR